MTHMLMHLPVHPMQLSQCFVNRKRGGRQDSKEYVAWKRTVDVHLVRHFVSYLGNQYQGATLDGPLRVIYRITRKDNLRRDLDNMLKSLNDALVRNYIIKDDSCIVDLRILYSTGIGHPVVIEISPVIE